MVVKKSGFSKTKIWLVFGALFVCGAFVGVGVANWNRAVAAKRGENPVVVQDENLTSCAALERVLLNRMYNNDDNCDAVKHDLGLYRKLATYGCDENRDRYVHEIDNKNAILDIACADYVFQDEREGRIAPEAKPCEQIEANLEMRLGGNYTDMDADKRVQRAKIYAIMAEKGCPENSKKYVEAAKKELEIARGISDDRLDERDTIEVVETYKRLKMQKDAEEVFNKVKKLTNPAIDFIIQVEKIINE